MDLVFVNLPKEEMNGVNYYDCVVAGWSRDNMKLEEDAFVEANSKSLVLLNAVDAACAAASTTSQIVQLWFWRYELN